MFLLKHRVEHLGARNHHLLKLLSIFRIHGLRAAAAGLKRYAVFLREVPHQGVGSRQVTRHPAVRPWNLRTRQARAIARDRSENLVGIPNPAFGPHQRLGHINRIIGDAGQRQVFVVQIQEFGQRGFVGKRNAVAPQIARFDVRGIDAQRVAFPRSGREPGPGMRRELRGMRAPVHPDGARAGIGAVNDECDDAARRRVVDGADLQAGGRAHGIDGRVRDALVLQHRNKIAIPCIGTEPRRRR